MSTKNGKSVVKTEPAGLPASLLNRMREDAGKGVSTAQEDNLVPLIYILQPLSPQVNKRNPDYIEGAEPGDIWLRNSPNPIVPGDEGVLFQPCYFSKDWVEWVPRESGGGFVGRTEHCPTDVTRVADPKNPNKVRFVRPNGNDVIETRYHAGFVLTGDRALPYIIPMSSSGHTISRNWMFLMNTKMAPGNIKPPCFASAYRLKTKERSNAAGTWSTWDISDGGWLDEASYDRGRELYEAFASGAKQAEAPPSGVELDEAF